MAIAAEGASAEDQPAGSGLGGATARLQQALGRLESIASRLGREHDTDRDGMAPMARLSAVEAERDLLRLKHRQLVQQSEEALGSLDRLIADAEAR